MLALKYSEKVSDKFLYTQSPYEKLNNDNFELFTEYFSQFIHGNRFFTHSVYK